MSNLSSKQIQKDEEIKREVLNKLFAGFQDEMKKIEEDHQKILTDIIKSKKNDE